VTGRGDSGGNKFVDVLVGRKLRMEF
jgi:hypothetical protein